MSKLFKNQIVVLVSHYRTNSAFSWYSTDRPDRGSVWKYALLQLSLALANMALGAFAWLRLVRPQVIFGAGFGPAVNQVCTADQLFHANLSQNRHSLQTWGQFSKL